MNDLGLVAPLCPSRLSFLDTRNNIGDLPKPIRDARRHRRSDAKRRVDAHEIVIHKMRGDLMGVVLDLLAERIRQPGEAAHTLCSMHERGAP